MSDSSEETAVEMNEISAVPIASETEENPFDSTTANGSGLTKHAAPHGAPKKNSLCYDIFMPILVVSLLASGIIVILVANNWRANDPKEIAKIYHEKHPYIDGKNQLPYAIKTLYKGNLEHLKLNNEQDNLSTDLPRLRAGKVGGVVWAAHHPCGLLAGNEGPTAVQRTLYQMDIIHRLVDKYRITFEMVKEAEAVHETFSVLKQLSSVISLEGGHQIHEDLGVLRMYARLGAVSMSLTADCSTAWSETENPYNTQYTSVKGLTEFGLKVIEEMNRIGMMVDLSHTSETTMQIALDKSRSPVIFSMSGAKELCNSSLNVPESLFPQMKKNGAVVMVPFFPPAICQWASDLYDRYRSGAISLAALVQQYNESPLPCGIEEVFAHVNYFRTKRGARSVGLSTNFDGPIPLRIRGLEDASKLLDLTARMVSAGYTESEVSAIIGGSYIQAWSVNEEMAHEIFIEEGGTKAPSGGIFNI